MQRQVNTFFTLRTALFTPRTPHFTLALHTPRFISSHLISSELFSSHFISSRMSANFFLTTFISSEHSSTFLILPKLVSTHLGSSARQKA